MGAIWCCNFINSFSNFRKLNSLHMVSLAWHLAWLRGHPTFFWTIYPAWSLMKLLQAIVISKKYFLIKFQGISRWKFQAFNFTFVLHFIFIEHHPSIIKYKVHTKKKPYHTRITNHNSKTLSWVSDVICEEKKRKNIYI